MPSSRRNKVSDREFVYSKDIEIVFGCSARTARLILQQVRAHYGKTRDQWVSIEEFCKVKSVDEQLMRQFLNK